MTWSLQFASAARKALQRVPNPDRTRLTATLRAMQDDPLGGDIVPLQAYTYPTYRRRVGNWRIIFSLDRPHHTIIVTAISRRTTTTYKKR